MHKQINLFVGGSLNLADTKDYLYYVTEDIIDAFNYIDKELYNKNSSFYECEISFENKILMIEHP